MKNFKWEPRYTVIAVYAFLVTAAAILFGSFVYSFPRIWEFFGSIVKYLMPFVYGFGLAFILSPMLRFFERNLGIKRLSGKAKRNIALLETYLFALVLLVVFFLVVIPTLVESVTVLAKNIAYYSTQMDETINQIVKLIPMENIPQEVINAIDKMFTGVTTFVVSTLMQAVTITGRVTAGVIDIIMAAIISLYMLANKEMLFAQLKKILYALMPERFVHRLIDVAHDSNAKFSGFVVGKIIDSIIIGILCGIGMSIFKMPFVTLVSLIIGVTNIIPYFGPFIGAIPGVILVFIGGGLGQAVGFAVFILVLQQFDGNILGPAILGQSTGLDAMWVIFAILLFGGLYGFVGMVIGVPLLSVLFALCKSFMDNRLEKKGMSKELADYASEKHKLLGAKQDD
ncbi:MAG: AI-2E family transporter [Angelakisella sp.]